MVLLCMKAGDGGGLHLEVQSYFPSYHVMIVVGYHLVSCMKVKYDLWVVNYLHLDCRGL